MQSAILTTETTKHMLLLMLLGFFLCGYLVTALFLNHSEGVSSSDTEVRDEEISDAALTSNRQVLSDIHYLTR